jgi:hypothetical protein
LLANANRQADIREVLRQMLIYEPDKQFEMDVSWEKCTAWSENANCIVSQHVRQVKSLQVVVAARNPEVMMESAFSQIASKSPNSAKAASRPHVYATDCNLAAGAIPLRDAGACICRPPLAVPQVARIGEP